MSTTQSRHGTRSPRVGDVVSFPFGTYVAQGVVMEDRGPLGRGGERILRVRVDVGSGVEPLFTEVPVRLATLIRSGRVRH
jgi:hypothetical protein